MDKDGEEQTFGIDDDMAFAVFHFLARIKAGNSATFGVLTDWLSMIPAVGLASRP